MSFYTLISIIVTVDIFTKEFPHYIRDDYMRVRVRLLFIILFKLKLNLFILVRLASKYLTLMNKTGVAISRLRQADSLSYSGVKIRRISVAGDLSESNVKYKTSFLFYLLLIVRTTYRFGIRKTSNVPPRLRIIS